MKECVNIGRSSGWAAEAQARAKYHLATLYEETGREPKEAQKLKLEARKLVDEYRNYAPKAVLSSEDEAVILDDMQPTFQGRFTGRRLLRHMQKWDRREKLEAARAEQQQQQAKEST